jgi:hypothetical protein
MVIAEMVATLGESRMTPSVYFRSMAQPIQEFQREQE